MDYPIPFSSLTHLPCEAQGNSFMDDYDSASAEESVDTMYVLYSSWEAMDTKSGIYSFRIADDVFTNLNFDGYLEPTRFVEFQRNPLSGNIYAVGRPW